METQHPLAKMLQIMTVLYNRVLINTSDDNLDEDFGYFLEKICGYFD